MIATAIQPLGSGHVGVVRTPRDLCALTEPLEAAGVSKRGPCHLRHTFATEAVAAWVSTFELSRVMGTSIE